MIASTSTIKDVAREAGVSETSVSLAFRANSRIGNETRARVLTVAQRLNYVPNLAARDLRKGSSNRFGFLVNDATNPFYAAMFEEASGIAQQHGYSIVFAGSNWDADRETQLIEQMVQARVRGMLLCLRERNGRSIDILNRYRIPYVVVDSHAQSYTGPYVANDFAAAADLAADHLQAIGCRRPILFTADADKWTFSAFARLRERFVARLQLGDGEVIRAGLTIRAGRDAFESVLTSERSADGIFCPNDLCALGVIEAAEQHGIAVGRDLAVIGIDDMPVSALSRVSLTSIRQPYIDIVRLAMEALVNGVHRKAMPTIQEKLPPRIICRASTCAFQPKSRKAPQRRTAKHKG